MGLWGPFVVGRVVTMQSRTRIFVGYGQWLKHFSFSSWIPKRKRYKINIPPREKKKREVL
jgi:hypothetical protein